MKKVFLVSFLILLAFSFTVNAQPGTGGAGNNKIEYAATSDDALKRPCNSTRVGVQRRRGYGNRSTDTCAEVSTGLFKWVDDDPAFRPYRFGDDGTLGSSTATIQAMIDAASNGDTIKLGRGTFVTNGWTISKKLNIEGEGEATIIRASALTTTSIFNVIGGASYSTFRNLRIEGVKAIESDGGGSSQIGISVNLAVVSNFSDNITIEKIHFTGTDSIHGLSTQVYFNSAPGSSVRDCLLEGVIGTSSGYGYGVLINGDYAEVTGNRSYQSATQGRHHVYLAASSHCSVHHNYFYSGTSNAVPIFSYNNQGWSEYNQVNFNTIDRSNDTYGLGGAIQIQSKARYNTIFKNKIISPAGIGIGVYSSQTPVETSSIAPHNYIQQNEITNAGLTGIFINGASDNIVTNNFVEESSQSSTGTYPGIYIASQIQAFQSDRTIIQGNTVIGTVKQGRGLLIQSWDGTTSGTLGANPRPQNCVVSGNYFPLGYSSGATLDRGYNTIYDTVVPTDSTVTSAKITDDSIVNADVNSSAAIAWNKLATGTASRMLATNTSGVPVASSMFYDAVNDRFGIGLSPVIGLTIYKSVNGTEGITSYNVSTGSGASTQFGFNNGTANGYLRLHGSGFTNSAYLRANGVALVNDTTGVDIAASGASGDIRFWSGGSNQRGSISNTGVWTVTGALAQTNIAVSPSASSTVTLDINTGNLRTITLPNGTITLTASNVPVGIVHLALIQPASGTGTITWNSLYKFSGGIAPTLGIGGASSRDEFEFKCDGTNCQCVSSNLDVR